MRIGLTGGRSAIGAARGDRYLQVAVLAGLGWTALMVQQRFGVLPLHSPIPSRAVLATPFAALATLVLSSPTNRPLRAFAIVTGTVALALLMAPVVASKPTVALAAPVLVGVAAALLRWPAVGLAVLVAVSGSFGALTAFLTFHYTKLLAVTLVGLWLATILRWLAGDRRQRLRFPLCVVALTAYLAITVLEAATTANHAQAVATLEHDDWYMVALLLVAFAGWSQVTTRRFARTVVVAAVLVGGYATLRWSIGPAQVERQLALLSTYNIVNGKLKLIGSFPNGADLALWTSIAIPFCAAFGLANRGRWRWLATLGGALCAIALVGSQVRAGTVAVAAGVLVTLLLFQASRAFAGLHLGTTAAAVAAIVIAAVGAFAITGGTLTSSHGPFSLFNPNDQSRISHTYKWGQALRDVSGHPFGFGVGSAATGYAGGTIPPSPFINDVAAQSVDSGYLKIALEQGVVVMGIFGAGLLTLLIGLGAGALRARDPASAGLVIGAAGVLTTLVVLFGAGAFMEGLPSLLGWMIIGLGLAQLVAVRPRPDEADGRAPAAPLRSPEPRAAS